MMINVLHMAHLGIGYGLERQLMDHLTLTSEKPNDIKHYVCALTIGDSLLQELKNLGIPFMMNRLWPWNLREFSNFVKKYNIQILHTYNQIKFPLRGRILPKIAGVKYIIEHEHGMAWYISKTRLTRITNKFINAAICNSRAAQVMIKQKCGMDAQVIYNGVAIPVQDREINRKLKIELGISEDAKIVGFVGRLNTPKGVEAFIRIIPLVKQVVSQAKFIVIGDGPMRNELEDSARSLGIKSEVFFLGYQRDARELMKQMDVVVVPSIREPFGNVVIEAALAKKPVIASNVDGLAEIVIDNETGFLIDCTEPVFKRSSGASRLPKVVVNGRNRELRPPRLPNIEMLAERVIKCLLEPEIAFSLGNNAYIRAINNFSLERYRNDLDNLYRKLMS